LCRTIPLGVLAFLTEPWTPDIRPPGFPVILAVLAIGGTAITFALWIGVLRQRPLNAANAFTMLTPVLGFAISVAFPSGQLTLLAVLDRALTPGGIALAAQGNEGANARRRPLIWQASPPFFGFDAAVPAIPAWRIKPWDWSRRSGPCCPAM